MCHLLAALLLGREKTTPIRRFIVAARRRATGRRSFDGSQDRIIQQNNKQVADIGYTMEQSVVIERWQPETYAAGNNHNNADVYVQRHQIYRATMKALPQNNIQITL